MMTLKRVEISDAGAFGVLQWYGRTFAVTIERTYPGQRSAQTMKIAPGVYKCTRSRFNKANPPYDTWLITGGNVTEDRQIKFHVANWETDVDGCIGVGESFSVLNNRAAIADSRGGFAELMILTADHDEFDLAVINV